MYGFMRNTWQPESCRNTRAFAYDRFAVVVRRDKDWVSVCARAKIGLIGYSHLHSLAAIVDRLSSVTRLTLE